MCSVRHRPTPSAPKATETSASCDSVFARTLQRAVLVGPLHELGVAAVQFRLLPASCCPISTSITSDRVVSILPFEDFAGEAVDRDPVALFEHRLADGERSPFVVDVECRTAADAGLAHLPADESRVRRCPAERRQNALGDLHAAQVFRARLATDQNQLHVVVGVPAALRRRRHGTRSVRSPHRGRR